MGARRITRWGGSRCERPSGDGEPGGTYTGVYNNDYEFSGTGDLDECNGTNA